MTLTGEISSGRKRGSGGTTDRDRGSLRGVRGDRLADPDELGQLVTEAEAKGFDSLWFSDLPMLPATDPMLAVAFVAARSSRLKLGVNLVPFGYEPFVFARQVAQLDQLTGGRLLVTLVPGLDQPGERAALGIGAARLRQADQRLRRVHVGRLRLDKVPTVKGLDDLLGSGFKGKVALNGNPTGPAPRSAA